MFKGFVFVLTNCVNLLIQVINIISLDSNICKRWNQVKSVSSYKIVVI